MFTQRKEVWVIMSKDRTIIAKGIPRNRSLEYVNDEKGTKRILTYSSKQKAESGFKHNGFFGMEKIEGFKWGENKLEEFLEAVNVELIINEIK